MADDIILNMPEREDSSIVSDALTFGTISWTGAVAGTLALSALFNLDYDEVRDPLKMGGLKYIETPTTIGSTNIRLISVSHLIDNFTSHRNQIEATVANSPFVCLEYFDASIRALANPEFNPESFKPKTFSEAIDGFFGGIGSICAEYEKDIIVLNPENSLSQLTALYMLLGLPIGLVTTDFYNGARKLLGRPVSRRNLLRLFGYGTAALVWKSMISDFSPVPDQEMYKGQGEFDITRWNYLDWRDLRVAQNLIRIVSEFQEEMKNNQAIPLFQGALHTFGVMKYLSTDPKFLDIKRRSYTHYDFTGESIKRFTFDKDSITWGLKQTISA